ncbi:sulfotransferase [Vibrio owensii]|uniref:Sulfotransferase n=1 Tax=Vibrio owensii TaxID=696485 RepID=A0AAP9GGY7_9VIBR|nr:sulfotransferase [Vibrio owensii]AYO17485.1 sulfotransferase [Vibrio owensii]QGH49627.1 hypothetical protein APZ19_21270 [Vibrio owensii]
MSMKETKPKVIYLIGAGRSGTTILATLLNNSNSIVNVGELHHLPDNIINEGLCSCGVKLIGCEKWSSVISKEITSIEYMKQKSSIDSHLNNIVNIFLPNRFKLFERVNTRLFQSLSKENGYKQVLDAAKFPGRALALSRISDLDTKFIYLVRDPRGVSYSFGKKVQTSKGIVSSCIYYNAINFLSEIYMRFFFKNSCIKVRYEDLLDNPEVVLKNIGLHLDEDLTSVSNKIRTDKYFSIGHIVGGNRLKESREVKLRFDNRWLNDMKPWRRKIIYFLTFPFNFINGYKL